MKGRGCMRWDSNAPDQVEGGNPNERPDSPKRAYEYYADLRLLELVAAAAAIVAVAAFLFLPWVGAAAQNGAVTKVEQAGGGGFVTIVLASLTTWALIAGVLRRRIPGSIRHFLMLVAGMAILAVLAYNYGSVTEVRDFDGTDVQFSPGLAYYLDAVCGLVMVVAAALMIGLAPFRESRTVRRVASVAAVALIVVSVLVVAVHVLSRPPGFSPTGSMTTARTEHTATLLSDGRVLIAGAFENDISAELYDPKTGAFSSTGSMTTDRMGATATLLSDGRVLIAGGSASSGTLASAELYDPKAGTFSATGSMTSARSGHTATLLSDGRVLIAGGWIPTAESGVGTITDWLSSAELYDPRTGTFSPTGSMTASRTTATLLSDGRVLVAGGSDSQYSALTSAELFDPASGIFGPTGSMTTRCEGETATLLADGRVLLTGSTDQLYDPATGTFSATGSLTGPPVDGTATLLHDGRVLIVSHKAELYDPKTGTSSKTQSMMSERSGHTATLLPDGRVLIAGGWASSRTAELYQP